MNKRRTGTQGISALAGSGGPLTHRLILLSCLSIDIHWINQCCVHAFYVPCHRGMTRSSTLILAVGGK